MEMVAFPILLLLLLPLEAKNHEKTFGPFNNTHFDIFTVLPSATIGNGALQITPNTVNYAFNLQNKYGRILFSKPFKLWESASDRVASFNTTLSINIYRPTNATPGECFAFIIAPDLTLMPSHSEGQYLGLTNASTDGLSFDHIVAVELDTVKQDFNLDDNHMGLDLNSIRSNKTVSVSQYGIEIAPIVTKNYTHWIV